MVACGCLIALSHDRLWLLATLAIGAVGALPAVLAVQAHHSLAENLANQAAVDQGVTVLLLLVAGTALALALFAGLRWLERRGGGKTGRMVELSRNPKVLKGVALAAALLAIGAAIAVGGRAWNQFSSPDLELPNNPAGTLRPALGRRAGGVLAGRDRRLRRRAAGRPRRRHLPVLLGPAAQRADGRARRPLALPAGLRRAGSDRRPDWCWRWSASCSGPGWRPGGPPAGPSASSTRRCSRSILAFAVGAAIDWFWQIAAVGAVFFLASGVLVAARCAQLVRARAEANGHAEERRYGLAVAGLAVAWITALALIGPLLVDREIDASKSAAADGNLASAVSHADTARSIEPWAASPYVQLGLLAEFQGEYATGGRAARARRSTARKATGCSTTCAAGSSTRVAKSAAARADLREARRLNPRRGMPPGRV